VAKYLILMKSKLSQLQAAKNCVTGWVYLRKYLPKIWRRLIKVTTKEMKSILTSRRKFTLVAMMMNSKASTIQMMRLTLRTSKKAKVKVKPQVGSSPNSQTPFRTSLETRLSQLKMWNPS